MDQAYLLRSLERRMQLVLEAPPQQFRAELAALLRFLAEHDEIRSVTAAALQCEQEQIRARQSRIEAANQRFVEQSIPLAQQLTALLPLGELPPWLSAFLVHYDEEQALLALEQAPDTTWAILEEELSLQHYPDKRALKLLTQIRDAELRCLALRKLEQQQSVLEITSALGRLWGHAFAQTQRLPPPNWGEQLQSEARRSWQLSSRAIQRRYLLQQSNGEQQLYEELCHDLRRVWTFLCDQLELRSSALPLLERLRRWYEWYERPNLLKKAKVGKKASEATRKRKEQELSKLLLQALFNSGVTPLSLDMLDQRAAQLIHSGERLVLLNVCLGSNREVLLRGYRDCLQSLRSLHNIHQFAQGECFFVAFLSDENARFEEPSPITIQSIRLHSLFIDLTGLEQARQPLTIDSILRFIEEEDRLLEFLNTASESDLIALKGIATAKANQIIAARPYTTTASLKAAGLPLSGALYDTLRERALQGSQTLERVVGHNS